MGLRYKYTGPDEDITMRGVYFPKDKAVPVDDSLGAKIDVLDYFERVKPGPKTAAKKKVVTNDEDKS